MFSLVSSVSLLFLFLFLPFLCYSQEEHRACMKMYSMILLAVMSVIYFNLFCTLAASSCNVLFHVLYYLEDSNIMLLTGTDCSFHFSIISKIKYPNGLSSIYNIIE